MSPLKKTLINPFSLTSPFSVSSHTTGITVIFKFDYHLSLDDYASREYTSVEGEKAAYLINAPTLQSSTKAQSTEKLVN